MDLSEPIRSVIPSVTGSVLGVLARAGDSLTGREIERRVKPAASHQGVSRCLDRLVDAGLVERVDKGRSALYSLNRDHVAATGILSLSSMRGTLVERITEAIKAWKPRPRSATLFGSLARGDGSTTSDVDLLIVRPNKVADADARWSRQLAALSEDVAKWSGNPLRPIVLSESELAEAFAASEGYLMAAVNEGISVDGTALRRMRSESDR